MSDRVNYVRALTLAVVLGLTFSFSGCKKKVATEETPEEAPPTATPPAKTVATPAPQPVVVATPTPPPAAPAPQLAPPGVFYLVTAVSVETSDGILGLKPGQLLREVRPGVYRADNSEVTLRPDQVTNDLGIARRLVSQDQRNQAAIQQRLAAHPAGQPSTPSTNPQSQPPSNGSPAQQDPRIAARNELNRQRETVIMQSNQVATAMAPFSAKYGSWDSAAKKSPQAFQLLQQFNALQKQRADIDAQISAIH